MIIFIFLLLTTVMKSYGWGLKGHNQICEAATYLVENQELREFLIPKGPMLGHLCNVPDIYWKSLSGDVRKLGDPTHYIDPEVLGLPLEKISLNFLSLKKKFEGKPHGFKSNTVLMNLETELGTVWWRIEQFYRLGKERWIQANSYTPPQNRSEEQNDQLPFNQAVFDGIVYLGLLGHFVGDAAQPFHVTVDYDGYQKGHGGIHSYYEEDLVNYLPPHWVQDIISQAEEIRQKARESKKDHFLKESNLLKAIRLYTQLSYQDIDLILKLDPILKPSQEIEEKGMKIRHPAQRKSAKESVGIFLPILKVHMARASVFLAHLWNEAYLVASKKKPFLIKKYKSYRYPFTPEFIAPDYLTDQVGQSLSKKTKKK